MADTFVADYEGAIVVPSHPTNYDAANGMRNTPLGIVLHTPEERSDFHPSTPYYFQNPNVGGSTHYFCSRLADIYQCVRELDMAYANGVVGKPFPSWANPNINLNWQTLSMEIEGYAETIQDTMRVGGPQFNALVLWIKDRCAYWNIPIDREHIIGHYEVSVDRSDPGALFPWDEVLSAARGEDEMTFVRANGIAQYFEGLIIEGDQPMNARLDFSLPVIAKQIKMQVFLENGTLIALDGRETDLDAGRALAPYGVLEPFLDADGWCTLRGEEYARLGRITLLGYWV